MKKIIAILLFSFVTGSAFAQSTTNTTNTTTSNTAVDGSTNVIVSTPNGTIGNQVNSPANSNNVYVVNGQNSGNVPEEYKGRYRDDLDRDELMQRRYDREYEAARQSHDYRDRPNYYNIRGNQDKQFNERNRSDKPRNNYQSRTRRTSQ